jgi:phosphoglycerate dehydrogenase-like enzyme
LSRFDRDGTQKERQNVAGAKIVAVGRRSSATLEAIAAGLAKLGHALQHHTGLEATPELISADIIIARPGFTVSGSIIASAQKLRGIVSPITGIDGIDITAATEAGVIVANGQVIENTESMAEATILLLLAAIYDLHGTEAVLHQNLPRPRVMKARMLKGKTVGLVGWGQISRAVAQRLAGWEVQIQASSRSRNAGHEGDINFVGLEELLRTSDIVCVLSTLNPDSVGLLNADRLRLLKQDAVLVNTARGAIIDEAALYQVARERPDIRLALDTFTVEPLPATSQLRELPNVILTPHQIGHTQESQDALPAAAIENIRRILSGKLPLYVCNPEIATQWEARWASQSL